MLGNVHSNLWLIQMPKNATKEYMEDMFLETPLQFDTMTFAFTLINGENKITIKSVHSNDYNLVFICPANGLEKFFVFFIDRR